MLNLNGLENLIINCLYLNVFSYGFTFVFLIKERVIGDWFKNINEKLAHFSHFRHVSSRAFYLQVPSK